MFDIALARLRPISRPHNIAGIVHQHRLAMHGAIFALKARTGRKTRVLARKRKSFEAAHLHASRLQSLQHDEVILLLRLTGVAKDDDRYSTLPRGGKVHTHRF